MNRPLSAITALVVVSSIAAASADEAESHKTVEPKEVTSLDEAKSTRFARDLVAQRKAEQND